MKTVSGITALLGLAALTAGITMSSTASAQDWHDGHRSEVRADYREIHHDEDRIASLEGRLHDQERHHDWRAARDTRRELDHMRDKLDRDRRDLHHDRR